MDSVSIEFTDRYGGNAPLWLRGCFECEAMGCSPEKLHEPDKPGASGVAGVDLPPFDREGLEAYQAYLQRGGERQADGWYFLPCEGCGGSGRVSRLRTLLRIPRWLWKGLRFTFVHAPAASSHMPYWSAVWLGFKCAYLVDLKLWKP